MKLLIISLMHLSGGPDKLFRRRYTDTGLQFRDLRTTNDLFLLALLCYLPKEWRSWMRS